MSDDDSAWQLTHDRLVAKMRPLDLPMIYHYTSVRAMVEILSRGQVWLSSAATMNDHSEGLWVEQRLLDYESKQSIARGTPRDLAESEVLRTLWQLAFRLGAPQAYIACFSESADMLSQWRAYADDGQGVAIGFDPNDGRFPVVNAAPHSNAGPDLSCTISPVRYADEVVVAEMAMLVESAVSGGVGSADFFNAQIRLSAERWRTKNPAFGEEREWRVINLPLQFDGDLGGGNTALSAIGERKYRASNAQLISYFEMPFAPDAVRELVLGPRCRIHAHELDLFLFDRQLAHVAVHRSAATYGR